MTRAVSKLDQGLIHTILHPAVTCLQNFSSLDTILNMLKVTEW